ncbi:DUF6585 family protein [Kitasatospora sp. NPDC002227]|uniref:DUF6585 family protein n=1 Tax=Kitasatospora sp. NPDC002227 TaxID=3154773 RepID=UPI003325895C
MTEVFKEQPGPAAAALAAERGLGDPVGTFATKPGWINRKWREHRLHLYTGGLVVIGPDSPPVAYDWTHTRALRYYRTVNGGLIDARYTLIGPDGSALNIGPGARPVPKKLQERLGITSLTRGAPFQYPGDWGDYLQSGITRAQLPTAWSRVTGGETLNFGPFTVDRDGVTDRKRTLAWSAVSEVRTSNGFVKIDGHEKREISYLESAADVPNLLLFLNLCQQLKH